MYIFIRWSLYFILGLPIQLLVYGLYPLAILIYKLFAKEPGNPEDIKPHLAPKDTLSYLIKKATNISLRNKYYIDDMDDHTALVHSSLWTLPEYKHLAEPGLENLLDEDGAVIRRWPVQAGTPVSGDCLASWLFAYVNSEVNRPDLVNKVAWHYLKNCFGVRDWRGQVSTRSSNGGVNFTFDGWGQLSQPCFGPQYYGSAAVFALAAKESRGWKKLAWNVIYGLNFIFNGGWLYWSYPILHVEYFQKKITYYVDHITAYNLYVLNKTKPSILNRAAFKNLINQGSTYRNCNPFFFAAALDCKALTSKEDWQYAHDTLLTLEGGYSFIWQRKPVNKNYFKVSGSDVVQKAAVAIMLLRTNKHA